jgi:hypothetical protein
MSTTEGAEGGRRPTEEELRAYEAELKKVRIEHILLENVVAMVNLGMRRTGLAPGTEDERDLDQVRVAIESIRALMPLLDQTAPQQAPQIRDALSQLQLAFVRIGGQAAPAAEPAREQSVPSAASQEPEAPKPGEPGPAQRSGRLWVPGQ